MKYFALFSVLIFFIPLTLRGQDSISVKRERVFTEKGLYGYMNGGADLYLEYGVQRLTVKDVLYKGIEYTIEMYEMPSAEDAFGIYSTHVFKCQRADTLGCFDCLSPYVLQAAVGNKYITVVFQSASDAAKNAADELLFSLTTLDCNEKLVIPELLADYKPYSGVLKFLRGAVSVSSVEFQLTKILEGISYSKVWFVSDKTKKENKALIYLTNKEELIAIKKRIPESNIIRQGEQFIFVQCKNTKEPTSEQDAFGF